MTETTRYNKKTKLPFRKSHAFIIGINDYLHLDKLTTAVNDAKKIAKVLEREQRFKVHPPLINASYKEIKHLLEKTIIKKVKEEDRVLFYFAGHGIASQGDDIPEGYIMPVDAVKGDINSYISMKDLRDAITLLPCLHVLLILDCCFSGAFKWSSRYRDSGTFMPKRIYKERFERFVEDPAWQVITSAAYDQLAIDILQGKPIGKRNDENMEHSPFAQALFNGLQGAADIIPAEGGDGVITATELYLYLRQQVEPQTIDADERRRQTPLLFSLDRHDKGEYIFLHPRHRFNLPRIPEREPYKGLNSFEEKDRELFYGRKRVIDELMQKIGERNLVVVTGASGTGKSSVVKAGLIPELRKQGYNILAVIRPGKTPVTTLEKALNDSKLFSREISFTSDRKLISEKLNSYKNILVIDQYEELVTQCDKKEDKYLFNSILKVLLDANKNNLFKIILTIRADFEPYFKRLELGPYWQNASYTVPPFTMGELREIIINPTIQEVLFFEPPKLVDRIINEVFQEPGALPLLSFTLSELYRSYKDSKRTDRLLREDDYDQLGGVIGALHKRADYLFNALDQNHQHTMRKIMLRMVSIEGSELAGQRVLMEELQFSEEEDKRVQYVLDKLLETRLLLKDKDDNDQTYVEPAHDALIRGWTRIWEWIEDHEKEKIILQAKLRTAVKDQSVGKGKLWDNDPRLDLLKEELQSPGSCMNKHEAGFVEKSIKLRKRKKNRAWTIAISVIIILSALSIFAFFKAREARREARIAQSNYYASQARIILNKAPATALRTAEEAYKLDRNNNVTQVLSAAAAQTSERPLYNVNFQHNYHVNTAVFSPSGSRILTASEDKTAKLWDLQGKLLQDFKHEKAVTSAAFSPDGRTILTVSRDKAAKLWDLQGRLLQDFKHEKRVTSAEFSPDGRTILTASNDNTARLWNVQGAPLNVFSHRNDVNAALFSPDGTRILTLSNDKTAWLLDLHGTALKGFNGVTSADFSSSGKHIVFVLFNNTVKLWNLAANTEKVFKNHSRIVHLAAVSPDDSSVLIAYLGGAVKLLDLDGQSAASFGLHEDSVTSALFSADGTKILTTSRDSTAKLWDLNGSLIADLHLHKDSIISAAFSPDGTRILTASRDNTAKMWDLKNQLLTEFTTRKEEVKFADFSPDGTKVITISGSNTVQLWDLRGNLKANLNKHTKIVHSAIFSPDGTQILTASADNTAKLWNLEGTTITDFNRHMDNVNSAVFSPDGCLILTASYDDTAKLWDLQGNLLQSFKHQKDVISAVFSPDGRKILTASFDKTARLWDLRGNLHKEFNKHSWQVDIAIFSPDITKILTVSSTASLWDVYGKLLKTFNCLKYLKNKTDIEVDYSVTYAVFSPDSQQVLTAVNDNRARLWNLKGELVTQFNHKAKVYSAVFSPDGTRVLTASADSTVKLWDLQGNLLSDFNKHEGDVYSAVFSADGKRILSASADKTVKLWYTPKGIIHWLETAQIPPFMPEENGIQNYK